MLSKNLLKATIASLKGKNLPYIKEYIQANGLDKKDGKMIINQLTNIKLST